MLPPYPTPNLSQQYQSTPRHTAKNYNAAKSSITMNYKGLLRGKEGATRCGRDVFSQFSVPTLLFQQYQERSRNCSDGPQQKITRAFAIFCGMDGTIFQSVADGTFHQDLIPLIQINLHAIRLFPKPNKLYFN